MKDARADILERIRAAVGQATEQPANEHAAVPRAYRQTGVLGEEAVLALFTSRLEDYDVAVHRSAASELARTVGQVLASRAKSRVVVPAGLPREWLPPKADILPDENATHEALDRVDSVVTGCTAAIALTGTIVLTHGPHEGRRALSLVPDHHVCIVWSDQVVETVPEGIRKVHALGPGVVTTISGPSATADIEMARIRGVHGPRTLDVILAIR